MKNSSLSFKHLWISANNLFFNICDSNGIISLFIFFSLENFRFFMNCFYFYLL